MRARLRTSLLSLSALLILAPVGAAQATVPVASGGDHDKAIHNHATHDHATHDHASGDGHAADHQLISQRALPDGGLEVTIAYVPSGVTPSRATPVGPGDTVTAAEPVDCNIQGAYALFRLCGNQRYSWSGTHPAIYFIDYSGAAWPVYEAVVKWNQSTAIDVGYRASSWTCPTGVHCVRVYSGSYSYDCGGTTNWTGCAHYFFDSNRHFTNSTYIDLNDNASYTYAINQETTCHEIGHTLGLAHNLFTSSCLYYTRISGRSRYPHTGDYQMLESIY